MSDVNLLDFLSADHQNLLESSPPPREVDVLQHLSVERDFLYPAISHHAATGAAIVRDLRHAERELEERLRDFEGHATPEHQARLTAAIQDHVTAQEELFTRLRELIPEPEFLISSESIALSIGGAPTHAHPHLPQGGLIGELAEDLTSAADHTFDHLHHKRDSESS